MVKYTLSVLILACHIHCTVSGEERRITKEEFARHNNAADCWIQIQDKAYNVTAYLAEHKDKHEYDLVKWCGKDATEGWNSKDGKNEAHSRKARNMLPRYLAGRIES